MSPADREEDWMLFIREHLPETAFSPSALDTARLPLQSAHGADTGRRRASSEPPPPRFVPCPLNLNGIRASVYMTPCPVFFLSLLFPGLHFPAPELLCGSQSPLPSLGLTVLTHSASTVPLPAPRLPFKADPALLSRQKAGKAGHSSSASRWLSPKFINYRSHSGWRRGR